MKETAVASVTSSDADDKQITCKLTSPKLCERKEVVLAAIKKLVIERKELSNGNSYNLTEQGKCWIQLLLSSKLKGFVVISLILGYRLPMILSFYWKSPELKVQRNSLYQNLKCKYALCY